MNEYNSDAYSDIHVQRNVYTQRLSTNLHAISIYIFCQNTSNDFYKILEESAVKIINA